MSPYATIALLALVLSVAAQNAVQTNVKANVNWDKSSNAAVGNVNVNGKSTPFTVSVTGNSNQPTFTIQSQNPAGKTTTVKIIPIKPITSPLPQQARPNEPVKPIHHDVPVPIQSAAPIPVPAPMPATIPMPMPVPVPMPSVQPVTPPQPVVSVRTSTFTATSSEPNRPTVTVRTQTISNSLEPTKPVTVTVISVAKPEPIKGDPNHFNNIHPTPNTVPTPPVPTPVTTVAGTTEPAGVNCEIREFRHHPECRGRHHEEKKRKGCNRRLWIKGCILGLAAFGALAFLALCCRICRGRGHSCCCRRRHPECERNPTFGIPAPVPMNAVGQPQQVFVVQAQPVHDPYFQPTPTHTNRSAQPFVQLNETQPDVSANYVIGYPQANDQPIYMVPQRN